MATNSREEFRADCARWLGYKPCTKQKEQQLFNCSGCLSFESGSEILRLAWRDEYKPEILRDASNIGIVEIGGLGSALRTTAVSRAIRELNSNTNIYWFTHSRGARLLRYAPGIVPIDIETKPIPYELIKQLLDITLNFEMSNMAREITATSRVVAGFAVNQQGKFSPASSHAEELQRLQIDDVYRKQHLKTMQKILVESIGLNSQNSGYDMVLPTENFARAHNLIENSFNSCCPSRIIGVNVGTSEKGRLKRWPAHLWSQFIAQIARDHSNIGVMILSGPEDYSIRRQVDTELCSYPLRNIASIPDNLEIGDFMAVVGCADIIVTADTFAMHAALAQQIPVVALTGPMPHRELELTSRDCLIDPKVNCSPCYYRCDQPNTGECMQRITVKEVVNCVEDILLSTCVPATLHLDMESEKYFSHL